MSKGKQPTVAKYMTSSPFCIGFDQSLAFAHRLMREHDIRHLPVLSGGKLVGILSDRDLNFAETFQDVDPNRVKVEEAMTPLPYSVAPDVPLRLVAREMAERKYGSAVVMQDHRVIGVLTTTDALRALADALEALAVQ